ncbi:MAG: PorP/SprF family type IX secretion system membrane protein [Bacteroidota bacterium]
MRQFIIVWLCFCAISLRVQAQQGTQYSLYMFNKAAYNPAYVGLDNLLTLTGVYRKQWVDLAGSPTSQHLNAHLPLFFINSGIGVAVQNDQIGLEQTLTPEVMYSYQVPLGRKQLLSIGVGAGLIQKSLNGAGIRTPGGEYQDGFDHRDNVLPVSTIDANAPTLSAGVYYLSDRLEIGISTKDILQQDLEFNTARITPIRTYFFSALANFDIGRNLQLQPSIFAKSDILQTQIDFSALLRYNNNILLGASFRGYSPTTIDAASIIGGWQVGESTRIVYSYDLTLSKLRNVSSGVHEILLTYTLNKAIGKGVPPPIIYNPRLLN